LGGKVKGREVGQHRKGRPKKGSWKTDEVEKRGDRSVGKDFWGSKFENGKNQRPTNVVKKKVRFLGKKAEKLKPKKEEFRGEHVEGGDKGKTSGIQTSQK